MGRPSAPWPRGGPGSGPDPGTAGRLMAVFRQACGRIGHHFIDSPCCFLRLFIDSHSNKLAPSVVAPGYAPAVSLPPGCHQAASSPNTMQGALYY
ncbi:hypothetical protein [Arcticibacter tournemirensis]|uniref:Uncharacterized protein n=1 Tax=Arcticibacter tournemirensis TaxID=699437 RepID=A0A4V1KI32_9SPHI|nr:hypothetical protein [Arcticibacter tournemirensis]RXF69282.1 hypothetical protein EKH83_11370 [Arcticibacter tournemirensis]